MSDATLRPRRAPRSPRSLRAIALLLAVPALLLLARCGGRGPEPAADGGSVKETGKEISRNPLEALQQVGKAAEEAGKKMEAAANRPPVEPLRYDALLPYLPEAPGWQAEEPDGSTTSMGEWKITVVSRAYTQPVAEGSADPAPRIRIQITDGGFFPAVYAPFHFASQFSNESTTGYQKGVSVEGNPGVEEWQKESGHSSLMVLVADRFLLQIEGDGVEPGVLRDWVTRLRLAELAKLA